MALTNPITGSHGGIRLRRATRGRRARHRAGAIEEAIEAARDGIAGVSLEGEPGIGKSRLLLAAADMAAAHGFVPASVVGGRGDPRPVPARPRPVRARIPARGRERGVDRRAGSGVRPALGRRRRRTRGLTPRTGCSASSTRRPLRSGRPRWNGRSRCCSTTSSGPTRTAFASCATSSARSPRCRSSSRSRSGPRSPPTPELVTLLADMDRMGVVRRLRVAGSARPIRGDLLRQTLGGPVAPATVAAIQAQAEGVPFVIEELARTYREPACSSRRRVVDALAEGRPARAVERPDARPATRGAPARGDTQTSSPTPRSWPELPRGRRLRDPGAAGSDRLHGGRGRELLAPAVEAGLLGDARRDPARTTPSATNRSTSSPQAG